MTTPRLGPVMLACVFATAAAVTALDYAFGLGDNTLVARREIHRSIISQTAKAPDRYRWLAPAIVEGPTRVLAQAIPYDTAYDRVSAVFYFLAILALLWTQFSYLRVWFTDEQALAGALLVACTLRITTRQHDYAPGSYLEPTLFTLGLLAILGRRHVALAALVAVATLNRETGIFLVMLYLATSPWTRRTITNASAYLAIWLVIVAGVRVAGGDAERFWTIGKVLENNLSQPLLAAFNITLLLGALWLFAVLGFRRAPAFVKRSALVIPAYLATVAIWGLWWEVRLLMPLYPLVLPLALSYLFEPRKAPAGAPPAPACA